MTNDNKKALIAVAVIGGGLVLYILFARKTASVNNSDSNNTAPSVAAPAGSSINVAGSTYNFGGSGGGCSGCSGGMPSCSCSGAGIGVSPTLADQIGSFLKSNPTTVPDQTSAVNTNPGGIYGNNPILPYVSPGAGNVTQGGNPNQLWVNPYSAPAASNTNTGY